MKKAYVITGTTRGLGKSLQNHLSDQENDIFLINRRNILENTKKNYSIDLNNIEQLEDNLHYELGKIFHAHDLIVFISNAAILEPLKVTKSLSLKDIQLSTNINFISPILILKFLLNQNKKVLSVNITSGARNSKNKGLSLYSSLKLAFYHFLEIASLETENLNILHFDPGLMDTDMQKSLRSKDSDFDRQDEFMKKHLNKELQNTDDVALKLTDLIESYIHENY